jgi:hypothetical protein
MAMMCGNNVTKKKKVASEYGHNVRDKNLTAR